MISFLYFSNSLPSTGPYGKSYRNFSNLFLRYGSGTFISLRNTLFQSTSLKYGCALISSAPFRAPNLFAGFLLSSLESKSLVFGLSVDGKSSDYFIMFWKRTSLKL